MPREFFLIISVCDMKYDIFLSQRLKRMVGHPVPMLMCSYLLRLLLETSSSFLGFPSSLGTFSCVLWFYI